ncbi:MAG TPA: Na+/H+ antiporter NhaC family protein [Anaerovoracaceae bacterium]|nr:Na+/H+ antiporter NhaC family protein [Anaerovoracaceae bacterium]
MDYGAISLIPSALVIILALATKRILEPLLVGAIAGFLITAGPTGFFAALIEATYAVMMDPTMVWIALVVGFFGVLILWLNKSGGAAGFSEVVQKVATTRKKALMATWILGILVFIDDYINAMAVGAAMRKVTDRFNISREYLAYIINSTGTTVCVLIPATTWFAFMSAQMEANGVGGGVSTYMSTIPYMFYPWLAVFIIPLVILGIIPMYGPLKKAEERAKAGQVLPDSTYKDYKDQATSETEKKSSAWNFALPMLVTAGVVIGTGEALYGVIMGLVTCFVLFVPQRLMKLWDMCDGLVQGFKDMMFVIMLIAIAFILQRANDALGLTDYVIYNVTNILSSNLLPAVCFLTVSILMFDIGSFWGIAAISYPIIIPLGMAMDVNLFLLSAAIISASAFGSQACFFSDAATITCGATQIKNMDYARCALPYIAIPFILSFILFVVFGYVI